MRPLCRTAMLRGNRDANRSIVWGVSAISGTMIMTPRPRLRHCWAASRYTSVFPEPVTPSSRKTVLLPNALSIALDARRCIGVSRTSGRLGNVLPARGSRSSGRTALSSASFLTRAVIALLPNPLLASASSIGEPRSSISSSAALCFGEPGR